jgi:hypothetical protein
MGDLAAGFDRHCNLPRYHLHAGKLVIGARFAGPPREAGGWQPKSDDLAPKPAIAVRTTWLVRR